MSVATLTVQLWLILTKGKIKLKSGNNFNASEFSVNTNVTSKIKFE